MKIVNDYIQFSLCGAAYEQFIKNKYIQVPAVESETEFIQVILQITII